MEENNTPNNLEIKGDPSVTLTIRLIMQGKEVGSIIGKKGEIVNRFREESGAKINISDGSCPERIVTVSGSTNAIFKAFSLITKKFEEWCSQFNDNTTTGGKTQVPIRLIVPASQCGSLIGKGGSKIKEIRESTGCSIQVASDMLPNSTEREVKLTGTAEQITQCIFHICCVMLESPPKGATIPYRPKPQINTPVLLANGQAYTIQGSYVPAQEMSGLTKNPLAGLAALGLAGMAPSNTGGLNPTALAALAGSQLRTSNQNRNQQQTNRQQNEMTVPNDLIGCIIGKGGTKIAEIRQISGAMIRISNCEEREGGNTDRTITISGNPDSVAVAQYLINMSVELQKANLQEAATNQANSNGGTSQTSLVKKGGTDTGLDMSANAVTATRAAQPVSCSTSSTSSSTSTLSSSSSTTNSTITNSTNTLNNPMASAIPLAQLLTKPGALNALQSLTALSGLTDLLGGLASLTAPIQTTGVHRNKHFASRVRTTNAANVEKKTDRNKFNPY